MIFTCFMTFFFSCGAGKPNFEGEWRSAEGYKLIIKNISDEKYDVKVYMLNAKNADNFISGMYSYETKEKELTKILSFPQIPMPNSNKNVVAITFSNGQLYIGGNRGGTFFTRQ